MEPIKVVIADDDAGMRLIERKMIEKVEGFILAGEAKDGDELLTLVEEIHPQIVFLDVEMPGKTGVECAKIIQDMDPTIVMIFATAHDQYMGDAFEVYAFDYLIKPFKVDRVLQTLERARDLHHGRGPIRHRGLPERDRGPAGSGGVLPLPQELHHQPEPHQQHHPLWPLDVCGAPERHHPGRADHP